ncbi:hypothetical protein [Heliorestis convoluta]|uniref:Uncharacterized protein n=1 Tax=Heliorestis convoluta TaxID=356322 RepID=A0A5Q2N0J2_9FIRM|nr:hypothetical protein [Heliorestis convoluta]QGG47831.1 hypothetical protein FTV88_1733 [Heliorestis convoluta]
MFRKGVLLLVSFLLLSTTLLLLRWDNGIPTLAENEKKEEALLVERALQAKGITDIEPVDVQQLQGDFSPIAGNEIILAITLGKHQAFLAAFEQESNRLIALSRDLSMVTKISTFELPGMEQRGLFVVEHADNRVGSFEETTWNRIFRIDENNVFQQVFAHVQVSEYYWHESWDDPKGLYWHGVQEESAFTYPSPDKIHIAKKINRLKVAGDPHILPDNFTVESQEDAVKVYQWDGEALRFMEQK